MTKEKTHSFGNGIHDYCRITTILAAVLFFILIIIPQSSYAEDYTDESGMVFRYSIGGSEDDRYVVITGCDKSTVPEDGTVYVPETIDGYPVRELGTKSLYAFSGMKKVVIPGSVQRIQEKAFFVSEDLKEVVFSEGLVSIGPKGFFGTGLQSVSFPASLESIGNEAFNNCTKLKEVSFPEGTCSIGSDVFTNCYSLEAFSVDPDNQSFKAIDGVLFSSDGSTLIVYPAMRVVNGSQPEEYTVPDGTAAIGDSAFQYAQALKSVSLADSVETIGKCAFEYCTGLQEFTLSSAIKTIGEKAFNGCTYITTITLPKGLASLPSDAFAGCQRIAAYNVEEGSEYYASDEGVLYSAGFRTLLKYPAAKTATEYTVPEGVETIAGYAFQKADMIGTIILPEGVKTIDSYAFSECYELSSITLPDTLETIGEYAFSFCTKLGSVSLPDSLKEIGTHAFYLSGITEIEVPGSVACIESNTFSSCGSLKKVVLNKGTMSIGQEAFSHCVNLNELTIPDTVESIDADILRDAGTNLPDGQSIIIKGYIDSAGETFVQTYGETYNLVFERAVQPVDQVISMNQTFSCVYGSSPFAIGASAKTSLTYESSNSNVASVSNKGEVTLTGVGTATITVRARETNDFKAAEATATISVKPGQATLKAKNKRTRKTKLVWSKVAGATGYEIYIKCPGQKKYHRRAVKSANVKSITHSRLRKWKKYRYKVRAFTVVDGVKVYGEFSKVRKVKIKK